MHILITVLLVLTGIITLLFITSQFMTKNHFVSRDIVINAPRQKVFDYVKLLKNQDTFNKHAMTDPDRSGTCTGTDGTVGFRYSWSGNKDAGVGQKEIMAITDGQRVEMEIRFVKPMAATARIVMELQSLSAGQTRVTWSNAGALKPPFNIMIPIMEKQVGKGMDESLLTLKGILEE